MWPNSSQNKIFIILYPNKQSLLKARLRKQQQLTPNSYFVKEHEASVDQKTL